MSETYLESSVQDIPALRGVFITAMPDCLLFDSWVPEGSDWKPEEVAAYFGDLVRANREGLKTLGSWSDEMQVTIESGDNRIVLREVDADFVCATVFDQSAPLGMIRLHVKRLLERIRQTLPKFAVEERPRGVRIIEFLERYAPDPHAVLLRVSLRSGINMEELEAPQGLSPDQVEKLESTTLRILGLQTLNV